GFFHAGPGSHDHHGESGVDGLEPGEEVETFDARGRIASVVQVNESNVEFGVLEGCDSVVGRLGRGYFVALALEQEPKGFKDILLVVGNEDPGRAQAQFLTSRSIHRATL